MRSLESISYQFLLIICPLAAKFPLTLLLQSDRTPLHLAAEEGHHDIVSILLDNNADLDVQDEVRIFLGKKKLDLVLQRSLTKSACVIGL